MRFAPFLILSLIASPILAQRISDSLSFEKVAERFHGENHFSYYHKEDSTWYVYQTSREVLPSQRSENKHLWPKKEGDYFEYDVEKRLIIYGNYKHNKEEGLFFYFGENGKVVRSTHYRKGLLNGQAKHYYSNAQLRLSTDYKKGKKHGEILGFYMHGGRLFTGKYKKDKMIGLRMYYDVKGEPANGEMTWRHENGVLKLTGKCMNGKPDGRFSHYNDKGELVLHVDYLNGLPHGAYIKYDHGVQELKECYHLGKFTRRNCR